MKNIFKLILIAVAITVSGIVFAQEGKKAGSAKTPAQTTNKHETSKKNNKTTVAKPAASQAKGAEAASNGTNPGGIAISENGVPTVKTATVSTTPNAPH